MLAYIYRYTMHIPTDGLCVSEQLAATALQLHLNNSEFLATVVKRMPTLNCTCIC